jgi:Zn-dependent M28 family amino/carboxypeptidase
MKVEFILCNTLVILCLVSCQSKIANLDPAVHSRILEAINRVSSENIEVTVKDLVSFQNRYTWEKQQEVAEYLFDIFQTYGIHVTFDEYSFKGKDWKNVVARIPGEIFSDNLYLLIAHFDSISKQPDFYAPGADDNAAGTAAVLEIARILKESFLESSVMFALFSMEEQGTGGSKHFAKRARLEGWKVQAVINLDDIAYNDPLGSLSYNPDISITYGQAAKLHVKRIRNYIFKFLYPHGIIRVAGRAVNRRLVATVSRVAEQYSKLNVQNFASDHAR